VFIILFNMKKIIFTTIFIIYISTLVAQPSNSFSIKIGEIAFTDWGNRYGIHPTLSYSHLYSNKLKLSTDLNGYYFERLNEFLSLPPVGFVESKIVVESNFKFGRQFSSVDNLKTAAGTGLSLRLRSDNIIVSSGVTGGGFPETILIGYGGIELGVVLYFESNYLLTDKFSLGIYTQANLYYPSNDGTSSYWEHKSPSTFSFGLSTNFYFGKHQLE